MRHDGTTVDRASYAHRPGDSLVDPEPAHLVGNHGDGAPAADVTVPGCGKARKAAQDTFTGWAVRSGTSFAAAQVAGTIAAEMTPARAEVAKDRRAGGGDRRARGGSLAVPGPARDYRAAESRVAGLLHSRHEDLRHVPRQSPWRWTAGHLVRSPGRGATRARQGGTRAVLRAALRRGPGLAGSASMSTWTGAKLPASSRTPTAWSLRSSCSPSSTRGADADPSRYIAHTFAGAVWGGVGRSAGGSMARIGPI